MIQNLGAYVLVAAAAVVLLSSTVSIGLAILSETKISVPVDFDVHLDEEDARFVPDPDDDPVLPINKRKLAVSKGDTGPEGVEDPLPRLLETSSQTRRVDEEDLPYDCGVFLYDHHVPGEGGDALDAWIKELVKSNDENASLISYSGSESKESFLELVEGGIQGIGPKDWKIVRAHGGLAFDADEKIMRAWRDAVEGENCHFVAAAVFSDPLDHSIKWTKELFSECRCTMTEFKKNIYDIMEGSWAGQLDSFLFNEDDSSSMDKKQKVKRGIRLLRDHFELVMVDGQKDLTEEMLRITGWKSHSAVKKATVSDGGLVYSKDLVSKYGKMSTKNGDADFIDAVNHIYHNSLGFLMLETHSFRALEQRDEVYLLSLQA